ncbi:hypothetical protein EN858_20100 [Mesorhizobium sp. M4B.F.Ca.ET.215.01.1.1]|nr:hypothetical protein EOA34_16255 [Mesorhizobium sp. M4B.F.Ca.ET.013.02.1.1]TGQ09578.1 hypothetical protein EN858_20100 [Mesorhizobium sp. M4B.F.Ca.ET.215.01.1.1]TGQ37012.1 hypothetical protein EN857_15565 [Mesorhizobium sp. M4B.F.Ca.ET.214.01.1.1]TGQ37385.1 hypothetical protein EN863_027420 [Mesorhizobium sp. M00.F.Ca.ET.220.01.1.1]TGQ59304.1 hypothetical protein EN854_18295 [Mesorhizobium sp. M4B.F.Ca.ET.211.01.1.1]TGQ97377.1 hypothetical protein EN846_30015 [Mesorhizobium sp. M4B.F.Ca.ET.
MVQTGCPTQNIPLADGAGHTLPAAAPIDRRPDRARLPVTMHRQSDGKVRHDGSSAAFVQPINPVAERGRLHGASELDARTRHRSTENKFVYYRTEGEERRCRKDHRKHNRLRWLDKSPHIVCWPVGLFLGIFRCPAHIAVIRRNVRRTPKTLYRHPLFHVAGQRHGTERELRIRPGRIRSTRAQHAQAFIAQAPAVAKKAGGGIARSGKSFPVAALGVEPQQVVLG